MTTNQIMSNEITSTSFSTLKSCVSLEFDDTKCSFKMKIIYFSECKQELWSQSLNTVWIISQEVVNLDQENDLIERIHEYVER
jgi:hypothetical protein